VRPRGWHLAEKHFDGHDGTWVAHPGGVLDDGRRITKAMVHGLLEAELGRLTVLDSQTQAHYRTAAALLTDIVEDPEFTELLTVPAYRQLP